MSALKSEVNFSSILLLTESIDKKSVLLKLDSKKVFEKNPKFDEELRKKPQSLDRMCTRINNTMSF